MHFSTSYSRIRTAWSSTNSARSWAGRAPQATRSSRHGSPAGTCARSAAGTWRTGARATAAKSLSRTFRRCCYPATWYRDAGTTCARVAASATSRWVPRAQPNPRNKRNPAPPTKTSITSAPTMFRRSPKHPELIPGSACGFFLKKSFYVFGCGCSCGSAPVADGRMRACLQRSRRPRGSFQHRRQTRLLRWARRRRARHGQL